MRCMTLSANAAFGSWIKNHDEDSEGFWRQDIVFLLLGEATLTFSKHGRGVLAYAKSQRQPFYCPRGSARAYCRRTGRYA